MADVVDAVLEHGDALRAEAEGEAGVLVRVVADAGEDAGMHHAGAHDLDPAAVAADAATFALPVAGEAVYGHIHARLDEGEVVAAEAHAAFLAEETAGELVEGALEVGEGDAFVHGQPLDLVEVPFVGGVGGLVTVALAGHDDAHRRLLIFHHPGLHGRGVGAEQHILLPGVAGVVHPEGVPHIAGRVALGDVEHLEVVVVPLDLWAFDHAEAHASEGGADFADYLGCGVQTALGGRASG